jgi:hypothetical protein
MLNNKNNGGYNSSLSKQGGGGDIKFLNNNQGETSLHSLLGGVPAHSSGAGYQTVHNQSSQQINLT